MFFRWILDGQLEGVDVSSELLQEGDDVPCLTGKVQLPQLGAGSSSRLPSGPAKCGGLLDLNEIKLGEDSAIPGRLRIEGGRLPMVVPKARRRREPHWLPPVLQELARAPCPDLWRVVLTRQFLSHPPGQSQSRNEDRNPGLW